MELTREQVMKIALRAGEILIASGAEVVRTEGTIHRILVSRGYDMVQAFVTPTVIMLTSDGKDSMSFMRNIKVRGSDLYRIALVNDFSRHFVGHEVSFEEATARLDEIATARSYHPMVMAAGGAVGSSAFLLLIGGTPGDLIPCFLTAFLSVLLLFYIPSNAPVLMYLVVGFLIGVMGHVLPWIGLGHDANRIIIGAMLPFLPGVPFTNGVRDFMYGDLISGTSRINESLIIIVALSFGAGLVVAVRSFMGGAL